MGALGASLWALGTSLGVFRGSLAGLWVSWSSSCEVLGGHQGLLAGILEVLGTPLSVTGASLAGPWATLWET